jgi:chromosomal replication initiation ATPase DnaA
MDDRNIWERILGRVETKINQHTFHSWFKGTALSRDEGQAIVVRVANPLIKNWLVRNYSAVLDEAVAEVGRAGCQVVFIPEPGEDAADDSPADAAPEDDPAGPDTPSARRTSLPRPRAARWPRRRRAPTTRCSSTAAWGSARRT